MGSSSSPCVWPHCPPPPRVLLSLQQKSTRCAQSAYHYPPGRAVPARLGCSGQSSGGSSCTHSAGELWFGPHYCPPNAGTRLPVGNPYPFLPSLVDMTVRGWVGSQTTGHGGFALWDEEKSLVGSRNYVLGTIWKERSRLVYGNSTRGFSADCKPLFFLGVQQLSNFS